MIHVKKNKRRWNILNLYSGKPLFLLTTAHQENKDIIIKSSVKLNPI